MADRAETHWGIAYQRLVAYGLGHQLALDDAEQVAGEAVRIGFDPSYADGEHIAALVSPPPPREDDQRIVGRFGRVCQSLREDVLRPDYPLDLLDQDIRDAGGDPDEVRAHGRALVATLMRIARD